MVKIKSTYKGVLFSPSPIPHHSSSMVNGHSENKIRHFSQWSLLRSFVRSCPSPERSNLNDYFRVQLNGVLHSASIRIFFRLANLCIYLRTYRLVAKKQEAKRDQLVSVKILTSEVP